MQETRRRRLQGPRGRRLGRARRPGVPREMQVTVGKGRAAWGRMRLREPPPAQGACRTPCPGECRAPGPSAPSPASLTTPGSWVQGQRKHQRPFDEALETPEDTVLASPGGVAVPAQLCQGQRDAWGQSQPSRDFGGKGMAENTRNLGLGFPKGTCSPWGGRRWLLARLGDPGPAACVPPASAHVPSNLTKAAPRKRRVQLSETSPHPDRGSQALGTPGTLPRDGARGPACI